MRMEPMSGSLAKVVSGFSRRTAMLSDRDRFAENTRPVNFHVAPVAHVATAKAADYFTP